MRKTYLGHEDGVHFRVVLEVLENLQSFRLGCGSVEVGPKNNHGLIM